MANRENKDIRCTLGQAEEIVEKNQTVLVGVVTSIGSTYSCSLTGLEIFEAINSGKQCFLKYNGKMFSFSDSNNGTGGWTTLTFTSVIPTIGDAYINLLCACISITFRGDEQSIAYIAKQGSLTV